MVLHAFQLNTGVVKIMRTHHRKKNFGLQNNGPNSNQSAIISFFKIKVPYRVLIGPDQMRSDRSY